MKATLLILAVCLTGAWCATHELGAPTYRPTPINPAVLSDPKPADKVTVIEDPKEVEKIKRDVSAKQSPAPVRGPTPTSAPAKRPHTHTTAKAVKPTTATPQRPSHSKKEDGSKHRHKRDHHEVDASTVKPLPLLHHHHAHVAEETVTSAPKQVEAGTAHKRDIPVPLVAKFEHPEETPQSGEEASTTAAPKSGHPLTDDVQVEDLSDHIQVIAPKKTTTTSTTTTTTTLIHPALRPHPVPVSELFARPVPKPIN